MAEFSNSVTYRHILQQLNHVPDGEITDPDYSYQILVLEVEIKQNFKGIIGFYNDPNFKLPETEISGIISVNLENYGFGVVAPRELVITVTKTPFYLGINSSNFMRLVFLRNQKYATDKTGKNYEIINDINRITYITSTGPLPITIGLIPNCTELRINTLAVGQYTLFGTSRSNFTYCYLSSSKLFTAYDTTENYKINLNLYLYDEGSEIALTKEDYIITETLYRYNSYRGYGIIFNWKEANRIRSNLGFDYLGPKPSSSFNDTFYNNSFYSVLNLDNDQETGSQPKTQTKTKNLYWAAIATIIVVAVVSLSIALFKTLFKDKPNEGKSQSGAVEVTLV
ncbi:hypothetical protein TVAG_184840 [Trichomonas vaginalis G3]|uniref:Uncharacterized protein n=1 Tax=Trichomonas vaginalis (strain ATCC PRA-98 / G3) TaxID=412133 RepID=A2D8C9_TRIV3|nr:hypothetical protein TVAGG3_0393960 [Trichomonas vaginalis G3]EAY23178.1 hypothetical protein TVAG_184840 [Trichomonas vaginalis G3]KAI5534193.1 hypothetical protein TVAGG3_0393960 [Trichomonas vaginalis G3]|eukprot:XP_001584164.1 hypothetical protein [Trichomonas vaginalis G3]